MNNRTFFQKFIVVLLAILGGCSVLFEMFYPLLIIFIWFKLFGLTSIGEYLFYIAGLLASVFNALRVGYLK